MSNPRKNRRSTSESNQTTSSKKARTQRPYRLAMHVQTYAKQNPNAKVNPMEKPFEIEYDFNKHPFSRIKAKIQESIGTEKFHSRFPEYEVLDTSYGIKIWNGKRSKDKRSSSLKNITSFTIDEGTADPESIWTKYLKTKNVKRRCNPDKGYDLVDVGIVVFKKRKEKTRKDARSATTKKKKGDIGAPDILRVSLLRPVYTTEERGVETQSTNPICTFDIDTSKYTEISEDAVDQILENEDDDIDETESIRVFKKHIITQFRCDLGKLVLNNETSGKQYLHKLDDTSPLYALKKRKAATEIKRSAKLVDWIKGCTPYVREEFRKPGGVEEKSVCEIRLAFGAVETIDKSTSASVLFSSPSEDEIACTQLDDTVEPIAAPDKKLDSASTKILPLDIQKLLLDNYKNENSCMFHSCTDQMLKAAVQFGSFDKPTKSELTACLQERVRDPSVEVLIPATLFEKLKESTSLRENLKEFVWEKNAYPPHDENNPKPPTQQEWFTTEKGKKFQQSQKGKSTSGPLNDVLGVVKDMMLHNNNSTAIRSQINEDVSTARYIVRTKNQVKPERFYDIECGREKLEMKLFDFIMSLKSNVHPRRGAFEERIFLIKMSSGEECVYTKEESKNTTLSSLVNIANIQKGEILHITSAVRTEASEDSEGYGISDDDGEGSQNEVSQDSSS